MRTHWLAFGVGCLVPALAIAQPVRQSLQPDGFRLKPSGCSSRCLRGRFTSEVGPTSDDRALAERPVVVELFTSQGCSSCPPADAIVAELARDRPELLPLTFHVTYWNSLGWRDPFSFEAATQRQRQYVALAVSPDVYTPAMVVEGRQDVVGSDRQGVEAALARAEAEVQTTAPVAITRAGPGLAITVGAGAGHGNVLLLGFDRQHKTPVGRGENGGRTLLEANIVRSMAVQGDWTGHALHLQAAMPAGEEVAVVVQADDGRVLGAARLPSAQVSG